MSYKHITINERCCIEEYLKFGWNLSKIAKSLEEIQELYQKKLKETILMENIVHI